MWWLQQKLQDRLVIQTWMGAQTSRPPVVSADSSAAQSLKGCPGVRDRSRPALLQRLKKLTRKRPPRSLPPQGLQAQLPLLPPQRALVKSAPGRMRLYFSEFGFIFLFFVACFVHELAAMARASNEVDCQWETWVEWSACQFTCGGGAL